MEEEKIVFPDGRSVEIHVFLAFMYGLSSSDVSVLHLLLVKRKKMTADEISEELNVTKASINKSLNNLLDKGLIMREKEESEDKRKGRPGYLYWVDKNKLYEKLEKDLEKLATEVRQGLEQHLQ
jgi:predicted transcriptional regulator